MLSIITESIENALDKLKAFRAIKISENYYLYKGIEIRKNKSSLGRWFVNFTDQFGKNSEEFFKEFQQAKLWIDDTLGDDIPDKTMLREKEENLKKQFFKETA